MKFPLKQTIGMVGLLVLVAPPVLGMTTTDCFDCHSDESLSKTVRGMEISLFVDQDAYMQSVHGDFECTDCHEDLAGVEGMHQPELARVRCGTCHEYALEELEAGGHPAECADCHGIHGILTEEDSRSAVYDLNVPATCCACHEDMKSPDACTLWEEGMHGIVVIRSGVIFSAVCNDCHGSHDIRGKGDPESMVARGNVNETCGSCHQGVVQTYQGSVHGSGFREGREDVPVCTSCHSPHRTERALDDRFLLTVVERCSSCHPEMGYTFNKNYHGQVTALGSARVAQCPDCHGAHGILRTESPDSMVHPDNLIDTCGACHPGANASFVQYMPHADFHDADKYPLLYYVYLAMLFLLSSVFLFFGIHSLLWLIRGLIEMKGGKAAD